MAQMRGGNLEVPAGAWSRRDVLQAGSLSALGLALSGSAVARASAGRPAARRCILLFLVGGPSHLDTFDPKPDAPVEVRGPYRPIRTNVSGICISEIFPKTARQADKFAILRSVHHDAAPVHDTGHQLMQTGRLFADGIEHPHVGCVVSKLAGPSPASLPPHVLLPRPIGHTGGHMPHGQTAGHLGPQFDPLIVDAWPRGLPVMPDSIRNRPEACDAFDLSSEPERLREAYGCNPFGLNCLLARRLVEHGTRFVTVNMYDAVFNAVTWDAHGAVPFCGLSSYREQVGPTFDGAYSTLLADLHARGLLEETLVVAMGEFGRTPRINRDGGRDHWPHCWSILFAGGGVRGGQVIGGSDAEGAFPKDRPTTPAEVVASIYHSLGIDPTQELALPDGRRVPIVEPGARPIAELFARSTFA